MHWVFRWRSDLTGIGLIVFLHPDSHLPSELVADTEGFRNIGRKGLLNTTVGVVGLKLPVDICSRRTDRGDPRGSIGHEFIAVARKPLNIAEGSEFIGGSVSRF